MTDFEWLISPPFSALAIFTISFLYSLTSMMLSRKFVNPVKSAEWQEEVKTYNADKERAKKTSDRKLLAKLRKQEKRINQIQTRLLKGQMLTMATNIGLFYVVWQLIGSFYAAVDVAYLPFSIPFLTGPAPYPLPIFFWYMICSFFSSTLLSRILGVGMGMGMQPQTPK